MNIPKNALGWLIEEENPSIRYCTMREFQELPESDPNLQLVKNQIFSYQLIKFLKYLLTVRQDQRFFLFIGDSD